MKKLFYVFVIVLFSQVFFSCTNDVEEELQMEQTEQSVDWNGDGIDDDED